MCFLTFNYIPAFTGCLVYDLGTQKSPVFYRVYHGRCHIYTGIIILNKWLFSPTSDEVRALSEEKSNNGFPMGICPHFRLQYWSPYWICTHIYVMTWSFLILRTIPAIHEINALREVLWQPVGKTLLKKHYRYLTSKGQLIGTIHSFFSQTLVHGTIINEIVAYPTSKKGLIEEF